MKILYKSLIFIYFYFILLFSGLERVAEELMGRRKWKLYQDILAHSQTNINSTSTIQNNIPVTGLNINIYLKKN